MFVRGFKASCEKLSLQKRKDLNLCAVDPLNPKLLAEHLNVVVWKITDVPGLAEIHKKILIEHDPYSWSAVTLRYPSTAVTILNSAHSEARQASDLMHELAHLILAHTPARVDLTEDGQLILNTYDKNQEEEANWLAGCLLLPRTCLLHIKKKKLDETSATKMFGVSLDMLRYRLSVTGVMAQIRTSKI